MKQKQFERMEAIMAQQMQSDFETGHVQRVLHAALRIAATEPDADPDVVILAVLLHDVGRMAPDAAPGANHAELGAEMAREILLREGWDEDIAAHVHSCVQSHSYGKKHPPRSIEAKILYDADKLDLCGATGAARSLLLWGHTPWYRVDVRGNLHFGDKNKGSALFWEYERKLKRLPERFYTKKGKKMAQKRQKALKSFFKALRKELKRGHLKGQQQLARVFAAAEQ